MSTSAGEAAPAPGCAAGSAKWLNSSSVSAICGTFSWWTNDPTWTMSTPAASSASTQRDLLVGGDGRLLDLQAVAQADVVEDDVGIRPYSFPAIACAMSSVLLVPPMSYVRTWPSAMTAAVASSSASPFAVSPSQSSIILAARIVAIGFAL